MINDISAVQGIIAEYYQGIELPSQGQSNKSIAIIGPPKGGKSWLAASIAGAVGATFVADFDERKESIDKFVEERKLPVICKTYVDRVQSTPQAWNELERDVARFKYNKESGLLVPAAYVLDSLTFLKKITENQFFVTMQGGKVKLYREVKVGSGSVRIPEGWDIINATRDYMLYLFAQLRAMGHLIVVFHERPIIDKTLSTPERPVYTGKIGINPPYINELLSVFNDVWRVTYSTAYGYQVTVKSTDDFDGACTFKNVQTVENADITEMFKKG